MTRPADRAGSPPPVLIVDDDELIGSMLSFMLERSAFETVIAPDAITALERAKERKFAFFVLDNMMPGMTGLDLARELKARGHAEKRQMIMITGGTVPDGAEDVVSTVMIKPFEIDDLLAILRELSADAP